MSTNGQSTCYINLAASQPIKVIAISSGKRGVGKSNIAVSLALFLAEKNKKVLLLDADLGLGKLDKMLGLQPKYNLAHVMQGICHLNDTIIQGPSGMSLIPGTSGVDIKQLKPLQHAGIIDAFNELTNTWEYLIIDTAAGISDTVLSFARSSQEIILVINDDPAALKETYSLIKIMNKRYQWAEFHIVANMVRNTYDGIELFSRLSQITDHFLDIRLNYLGAIPFDQRIPGAISNQQSVVMAAPDSMAAVALAQLAATIDEWPIKLNISSHTSFFLERSLVNS